MKKIVQANQQGLTYIETILYVGIFVIMMATIVPFAWTFMQTGSKSTTQQEVFSNMRYITQQLLFTIRNVSDIVSITSTSATLATADPARNPTVIDLSNGIIRIKQGTGSAVALNSNDTSVSALLFTNYTSSDFRSKNVRFTVSIKGNYSSKGQEYTESTTTEGSAELRTN